MRTRKSLSLLSLGIAMSVAALAQTPVSTAFTYQGRLTNGGSPASGPHDFIVRLFDVPSGGTQLAAFSYNDVSVTGGLFTLNLNFAQGNFAGDARYLQVEVRPGASSGAYSVLNPRQNISPTPYAIHAIDNPWSTSGTDIFTDLGGSVVIGADTPLAKLDVRGDEENTAINDGTLFIQSPGGFLGQIMTFDGSEINGWSHLHLNPDADTDVIMVEGGGMVGIDVATPAYPLDVNGRVQVRQSSSASAGIYFYQTAPAEERGFIGMRSDTQMGLYGTQGAGWGLVMDVATGRVGVNTATPAAQFHVNGTARVNVLEIVGADVAEKFPVSGMLNEATPGTVMEIDPDNAGKLRVAQGAYNKRVAGVVSGAGDLPAGTVLGHLPGNEDAPAIALSGRVWVRCDASTQAIEIGDLLTTSDTPGHAMSAADATRSHGAVIGKAMTCLAHGQSGLVLVLVNLQ